MMNRKKVYIIHGYGASPTNHWFPWLSETLSEKEISADILKMPTPLAPKVNEWLDYLSENAVINSNTFFVAHSLGCISLLKYLHQSGLKTQIGGIVLVSGFLKSLPILPEIDEFVQEQPDYNQIIQIAKKRAVIAAKDDNIVPFSYSKELSDKIQADFYAVEKGGHFLDTEGFITLPIVHDILSRMIEDTI
ncbi:RBBP9/YdeN family alpha/beta hydrolase [Paenibacillus shunpengii]|uniref:RBBP9/YdeN family alpha/beta hydrolase n=1 Tax=Paenibacillus shunpengii TaxID=2054424 RepID=A0ABW5SPB7_9BACL